MGLLPFAPARAAVVAGWPRSPAEVVMWCGEREFPVREQTGAGFAAVDARLTERWNEGQPVRYAWLGYAGENDPEAPS